MPNLGIRFVCTNESCKQKGLVRFRQLKDELSDGEVICLACHARLVRYQPVLEIKRNRSARSYFESIHFGQSISNKTQTE